MTRIHEAYKHISSNTKCINDQIDKLVNATELQPNLRIALNILTHSAMSLLDGFLCDIADIAAASRPEIAVAEREPELDENSIRAAFDRCEKPAEDLSPISEEARRELDAMRRDPKVQDQKLDEMLRLNVVNPGWVYTGMEDQQPGPHQALADRLARLCCAETEGQFFNVVTDNITTIIKALEAYERPLPLPKGLLNTPKEGTQPFKAPPSPVNPPEYEHRETATKMPIAEIGPDFPVKAHSDEQAKLNKVSNPPVCSYSGCLNIAGYESNGVDALAICEHHYIQENGVVDPKN